MERIRMKDLPSVDRPYEKCLCFGPGVLTDAELLAVIIRTGSRDHSSWTWQESFWPLAARVTVCWGFYTIP